MLVFVGLGLQGGGLTVRGLEELKDADEVYVELYTSLVPNLDLDELGEKIGKSIRVLGREDVEQNPDEVLKNAGEKKVAFLVPGDPMVATTHVDLRLRASDAGVETKIIHGASIETAAAGEVGLQSYKFGKSVTIPFPEKPSETPYEVLEKNQELGLHTLFLLDIEAEKERYLKANEAINYLLSLEKELQRNVFTEQSLSVVVARADSPDVLVKADRAKKLVNKNFGNPPHVLIVPGKLHFLEVEALENFADAPKEVVQDYVEE